MRSHPDLTRRLLALLGERAALTTLSFGAPASIRLLTAARRSRP
jgi:hypothetical protein